MKFISFSRFVLISIFPLLVFLLVLNFTAFDQNFYEEKFSEYDVAIEEPVTLHQKVIDFIRGYSKEPPDLFNAKEKQHLLDVRDVVKLLSIILYVLMAIFILLLIASLAILKVNNKMTNFVGKVMMFGGILTVILAVVIFILLNLGFSSAFESFHKLFFEPGTYSFEPSESLVRLYPEQIFMDIGFRMSGLVLIFSALAALLGFYIAKPKRK